MCHKHRLRCMLDVRNLRSIFPFIGRLFVGRRRLQAVDGISFRIHEGETLGLVGESGCGKTTACRTILRLYDPTGGRLVRTART